MNIEYINRFFSALKSVNELDKLEIRNIIAGVLNPTVREQYVTMNYHRAAINVELVLTLTDLKQFQAITMLARSVFETAVELRLIRQDSHAAQKISLFEQVEKLKAARKIVTFKASHPNAKVLPETYEEYITKHGARIESEKQQIWPGSGRVDHWTLKHLAGRCALLGGDYEEIYQLYYPELSWFVHSGTTGVNRMTAEGFANLCGVSFTILATCYGLILEDVINEFKLYYFDDKLKSKITYAKMIAFTNSSEQIDQLAQAFGL